MDLRQYAAHVTELTESGTSFVTVTLVSIRGSAPQVAGAKMIVTASDVIAGTVGGGKIEAAAIDEARRSLSAPDSSPCRVVTWNLQRDIGMTCGGEVQLLLELTASDQWPIAVFGAGHIAQALVPLLLTLRCQITCIDPRIEWLDRLPKHRRLTKICTDAMADEVEKLPTNAFIVSMTRGHASDLPVLERVLKTRQAPFVGVIGSQQKASRLRRDLKAADVPEVGIESFHCPLGLKLGNNTPAEIAISIAAQLILVRDQELHETTILK